jgi:hypothetical protein
MCAQCLCGYCQKNRENLGKDVKKPGTPSTPSTKNVTEKTSPHDSSIASEADDVISLEDSPFAGGPDKVVSRKRVCPVTMTVTSMTALEQWFNKVVANEALEADFRLPPQKRRFYSNWQSEVRLHNPRGSKLVALSYQNVWRWLWFCYPDSRAGEPPFVDDTWVSVMLAPFDCQDKHKAVTLNPSQWRSYKMYHSNTKAPQFRKYGKWACEILRSVLNGTPLAIPVCLNNHWIMAYVMKGSKQSTFLVGYAPSLHSDSEKDAAKEVLQVFNAYAPDDYNFNVISVKSKNYVRQGRNECVFHCLTNIYHLMERGEVFKLCDHEVSVWDALKNRILTAGCHILVNANPNNMKTPKKPKIIPHNPDQVICECCIITEH